MDYCNITPNTLKYIFIGFKNTTRVAKCSGYLDSRHRKLGRQNSIKNELRQDVSQLILAIELYCWEFLWWNTLFSFLFHIMEQVICKNITNANELLIFHLLICMITLVLPIPLLHLHFNNEYFITSNYQKKNRYRLYLLNGF